MIGANQGTEFADRVEFSTRYATQKDITGFYFRKITITEIRRTWKIVGFTSQAEAEAAAREKSETTGNESAVAARGVGGFWEVSYVRVTETRTTGPWYHPGLS